MAHEFPDLPGWSFDADEISLGVYRAFGRDRAGRNIEATGLDPDVLHGLDVVSGPMLGNPRAFMNGVSPTAFGQQMSFHSDAPIKLLNNSLLPK